MAIDRGAVERLQQDIDNAVEGLQWRRVVELCDQLLAVDPGNSDAQSFRRMASRRLVAKYNEAQERLPESFLGGRYKVRSLLGEGRRKKVYLAHDTALGRDVAFAIIKADSLDADVRARLEPEARIMGQLGAHPRIVTVHDRGHDEQRRWYLVMEHMAGGDLAGVLDRSKDHRLSFPRAVEIGRAVCEGLSFLHSHGVVHRDLKTSSIWLSADGEAKIGDFGPARGLDDRGLTGESAIPGTAAYISPEQATGGEVTPRSDLYALGVVLYELVSGRQPFLGDDELSVIGQHINSPPVAPSWHNAECPRALEALILRLLEKDPRARPESAADVAAALAAIDPAAGPGGERDSGRALDAVATGIFVGRRQEMSRLKAALERALSGQRGLVMLVGEPGIGKTRSAQELATYAGLRNALVLWGSCREEPGAPPLWPWIQVLRAYVREVEPRRLQRELGTGGPVIAEMVAAVRERLPELPAAPRFDDPEAARFRLFDAVSAFLASASRTQPLVLILDDLHTADTPTLQLLEFAARSTIGARLLMVGTYRDVEVRRTHPLLQSLANLTREHLFERVLLRGLTGEDVGRFIERAAGVEPPAALVTAVYTNTEGNPLFVSEVVRLLVQEGALVGEELRTRTRWSVRIPEGVREVIGRRLDRLSARANETLRVAAVLGREFTLRQLERTVQDASQERLLEVADELLAERLVEELPALLDAYRFTHALVRQTLLEEISITRRARLHAQIAEALEGLYGTEADKHAAELAYHCREGQAVLGGEKLVRYALPAGEQALQAHAYEQARDWFQAGLAARGDAPMDARAASLLAGSGRAQLAQSSSYGHAELFGAFDYYAASGDTPKALEVASYWVDLGWGVDASGSAAMTERALELVTPETPMHSRLLCQHGRFLYQERGDIEGSRRALREAAALARRLGDETLELRAVYAVYTAPGEQPIASMEADVDRARRLGQPILEQQVVTRLLLEGFESGHLEVCRKYAPIAVELMRDVRSHAGLMMCWTAMGYLLAIGDWECARDLIRVVGESTHEGPEMAGFLSTMVECRLGSFDAAREYMERHAGALLPFHTQTASIWAAWAATLAYESGQVEILRIAEGIAQRVRAADPWRYATRHLSAATAGLAAVVRGDRTAAAREYKASSSVQWGPLGFIITPERLLGLLALTTGDVERALGHFRKAVEILRAAGASVELAWACYESAEALVQKHPGNADEARSLLDEASRLAQTSGLKGLAARVATELAGLPAAGPAAVAYPDGLTEREVEVLRMLGRGLTNKEVGDRLFISTKTVASHLRHIYEKAGLANRAEAAAYAIRHKLADAG